jgi:hypothetical protein
LEIKILQQKGYGIASLNIQIPKEDEGDFHPEAEAETVSAQVSSARGAQYVS